MKKKIFSFFLVFTSFCFSQESISELLKMHKAENTSFMSVQELAMPKTDAIILDAREINEYHVSHIKGAIHVGFDNFDLKLTTKNIEDKDSKIVVYCSLGIRSDRIAKQLKKVGYTNVYNLFGGIFEWNNNNFKLYDIENKLTKNVHVFSKTWSHWLKKGIKIYE